MDKFRIMTIIIMAVILASCSSSQQDDPITPEPSPNPQPELVGISFGGNHDIWQDATTTRAGKTGLETLFPSFRVWGYKTTDANLASTQTVMDGYNVKYVQGTSGSTTSNSDDWEYVGIANSSTTQTIKYWDYSASSYRFFAYSPSDANISVSTSDASGSTAAGEDSQSFSYPVTYSETATDKDFPYISQLWLATGKDNYGKNVVLTFAPLIAKVRFRFIYPDDITQINIKDIQFQDSRYANGTASMDGTTQTNTPLKGTLGLAYPLTGTPTNNAPTYSWTTSQVAGSTGALIFTTPYEEENATIHINPSVSAYGKWYYCLPYASFATTDGAAGPYTQGSYTITARIDGNHSTATVPAEFMQWKAGYQYTYTFKITEAGTQIVFSDLQVELWQTAPNTDNNGSGTAGW